MLVILSKRQSWEEVLKQVETLKDRYILTVSAPEHIPAESELVIWDSALELAEPLYYPTLKLVDRAETDALVTPCHVSIFVEAVFTALNQPAALMWGTLTLVIRTRQLVLKNQPQHAITLTDKEVALLKYLYDHQKESVSKDELLSAVWGYKEGIDTHTLETHIYRLRQKVEEAFPGVEIVQTTAQGYQL